MIKIRQFIVAIALIAYSSFTQAQVYNGYVLYSNQNSSNAYLIDTSKVTYHSWTGMSASTGYSAYLEAGGTLVRASKGGTTPSGTPGGPICGKIQKHDYNGTLVWDYVVAGTDFISHHDICPMPNGNVLAICYERKTAAQSAAAGKTSSSQQMWPDMILEIQPTGLTTGTVVWEWHTWDHLVQNVDSTKANYHSSISEHPELININYKPNSDWQHANGVDYNPILDQVTFSSHNLNEWYIIDHSTTTAEAASHSGGNSGKGGDILYRWGNPAAYGITGTAILNVTHDAHWIPEGVPNAGRLVGFNNKGISNSQSSVDQVITPINGYNYDIVAGQAFAPSTYTSRIACTGSTSNMGGSHQLPNGNSLVTLALSAKISEFNAAGNEIWTKTVTGGSIAKAKKYDSCYIFNTPPAIPTVTLSGSTLTAPTATTYQWYKDGVLISGATSMTYNATATGIYVVRVTNAAGCVYRYSKGVKYTKPNAVSSIDFSNELIIYPNPSTGLVSIKGNSILGNEFTVSIFNTYGQLIQNYSNSHNLNLSTLSNGTYTIMIHTKNGVATKKVSIQK